MSSPSSPAPRRGSCLGRVVKLGLVAVVLLAVLVGFLPTILSSGPVTRAIANAASDSINGRVSISKANFSWGGPQQVSGLQVDDAGGRKLTEVDVSIGNGLIDLARGGWKRAQVTVGGWLDMELRPDGTTNFSELAKPAPTGAPAPAPKPAAPAEPLRLPSGLDATLSLAKFDVTVREQATGRVLKLNDLDGQAVVSTERPISLKLAGASEYEGRIGSIQIEATATDLVRRDGTLAYAGAKLDAVTRLGSVVLPLPQMLVDVKSFDATIRSGDLTKEIVADLNSSATIDGNLPSSAKVSIKAKELLKGDGAVAFKPENVVVDVQATNVPTAVAQPFLAGQPILLSRDIGPTLDATVRLPGGGGDLQIQLQGANLAANASGTLDEKGTLRITALDARTTVQPDLIQSLAGVTSLRGVPVVAEAKGLALPRDGEGGLDLPNIAMEALTVRLPGTVELVRPAGDHGAVGAAPSQPLGTAQDLALTVSAPALSREVRVTGGGTVEGGTLSIDQRVTNLFGKDGAIDPMQAVAMGTIALKGVAPQRLLNALDQDTAAIARELLTGPIEATVTTSGGAQREARLAVASGGLRAEADATLVDRKLSVASAKAVVPATSALLAALQKGSDAPIQTTPTALTASLAPLTVDLDRLGTVLRDGPPIVADLALADATFTNVPGTATPLGLNQFAGKATITPGAILRVAFDGGARATAAGATLTSLTLKVDAARNQDKPDASPSLAAEVKAPDIQVAAAEALLGRPAGSLTSLLGRSGSLELKAAPRGEESVDLTAVPNFETLKGRIEANVAGQLVAVREGRLEANLTPAQLNDLVATKRQANAAPAGPAAADAPATLSFTAPLGVKATLGETLVDLNAFAGEPFDPAKVKASLDVSTTPIPMLLSNGERVGFDGLSARVATPRLDQGVTFSASAQGAGGATLKAEGAVRNLVNPKSVLDTAGASIDLKAEMKQLPTLLLDRLQDMDGLLATALGDLIDGSLTVSNLSSTTGTISANLAAPNTRVDVPLATLRDGLLVIEPTRPISGHLALTPPLRQRLLFRINPILADLRQTQQPIKLAIPSFAYPTDGNLTRLDGDITLTFGEVAFDTGSQLLGLLDIFNKKQDPTIPGLVEPLNVVIRKGQLTYKDFALRVGRDSGGWKHSLDFAGDIDLTQQPPYARAIKSLYPIEGLSRSIKELQNVPLIGAVAVGVTFFGPLYDPQGNARTLQSKIDVQVKPEDILKDKAIQKGLDEIFKRIR